MLKEPFHIKFNKLMRNSRNGNGRSDRSSRQSSDQNQYGSNRGYESGNRDEGNYDREDNDRNQGQDQDFDSRNYGRGSQNYGSDYDRGMRNDYGNNSYTENEGYDQGGGNRGNMGQSGQRGYDQNFESNDWARQRGGQQNRRGPGQDNWSSGNSGGYGNWGSSGGSGSYGNETRNYGEDYGRMGGSYGRGSGSSGQSGSQQGGSNSGRGTSSFNTNRGGQWGGSVESMRGKGPKGYRRSDERIQEQLNDILTDDDMLDASNIEVTVKNGEVSLSGTVNNREAKRRAEDLVESISGVNNVENRIKVSTEGSSENRGSQGSQDRGSQESDKSKTGQSGSQNKNKTHQNAEV